jgi:hypothetical protein
MPFIRGRFHINPIAGEALEAAREAEAALLALQQAAQSAEDEDSPSRGASKGPVHRVEIEAADISAPPGRPSRGFVARVHRAPAPTGTRGSSDDQADGFADEAASSLRPSGIDYLSRVNNYGGAGAPWLKDGSRRGADAAPPETHVFADHRDLISFLRDLLATDCKH